MRYHNHVELMGKHAFLSPSKYHWLDYSDDKLVEAYRNSRAMEEGIELHDFARRCIERSIRLPRKKDTLNQYVNDAIKYGLKPEQPLYFSDNCFGTADAIGFDESTQTLRIFDLKTGTSRTDMRQLRIYAAIFCLEYWSELNLVVWDTNFILRIYQNKEFREEKPCGEDILKVMDTITWADDIIENLKQQE